MKEFNRIGGLGEQRSPTNTGESTVFPCTWGARGWTGGMRLGLHKEEERRAGTPIRKKLMNLWFEMKKKAAGKSGG